MSKAEETNNREPDDQEQPPAASFSGSAVGPGSQIGRFRIKQELSRGPMGVVYLAHDTKLDRPVAIKSLPAEVMGKPVVRSRFQREARLLASLNHPNIATIYEELKEAEGVDYLVLEYVPGETLAERIERGGVNLEEALSIALQIAEAVSAAHDKGVVHRDLKPGNVKITPQGKVKVLDFGIAKLVGAEVSAQKVTAVTQPGQVIGTPGYMSPEQARGKATDHRSDIWSFGCMLYEMLTGTQAFPGQTTSDVLALVLMAEPDLEALPTEVGPAMRDLIRKCLQKDPERRYQSAVELHQDLVDYRATLTAPVPKAMDLKALLLSLRKPRVAIGSLIVFLALCVAIFWLINRSAKVRWARFEALPEIERLIEQDKYLAAFSLARQAEKYISRDSMLIELWPRMSRDFSIITTPPRADIFFKEYSAIDSDWAYLGRSPLENIRFPIGVYRWEIRKEGFETVETVRSDGTFAINLDEKGGLPLGMVSIRGRDLRVYLAYFRYGEAAVQAPPYLIDKYEVTNEQFKEFVDHGAYEKQEYWKHKFIKDGQELSWQEAMNEFRDKTGRPGPSTWEGGTYPRGQENYPVSGVSWYEAAAYAEFAGKSLPTIYHWSTAACTWQAAVIIPFSNIVTKGPAPVGSYQGMGWSGLYDMAGNVKEWCFNAVDDTESLRYILGGAWTEQDYMFTHADMRSPWDRPSTNGFRCVKYLDGRDSVPDNLFSPISPSFRDYTDFHPVSDEIFQVILAQYSYDRMDPNAVVELVDDSDRYWRKEKVTFDAAYGSERVIAYLFLPKGIKTPYQTVVYFPGSGAIRQRSSENLQIDRIDFIIQSGRAVLYPVYKGTYGRNDGRTSDVPDETISYKDWVIQLAKDLRRSIDYLAARNDIDIEKLAYYGFSWGGELGPIMLAVEDRLKLGVLMCGGAHGCRKLPEVEEFNFAPHVKVPVLMINGRHDSIFPVEFSQKPFFESFGTPQADKKHVLYPGGHGFMGLFAKQITGDVLGWLDRYLGPVD